MKTNIALIGFMGSGKSTIAKALAVKLNKALVVTDSLIEQRAGKPISRIFQEDGEIVFRELEINIIKEIASQDNLIIDCGGGIVLNRINIDRLKQKAMIVWLTASPEIIARRTAKPVNDRPLLQGVKKVEEIQRLMLGRQSLYEAAADYKIDTSDIDVATVVDQIEAKVK